MVAPRYGRAELRPRRLEGNEWRGRNPDQRPPEHEKAQIVAVYSICWGVFEILSVV